MRWKDSDNVGRSGFVQSRLYDTKFWEDNHRSLAEIEFHAPIYYIHLAKATYWEYIQCKSLDEAKAVGLVHARFNQAQLTN